MVKEAPHTGKKIDESLDSDTSTESLINKRKEYPSASKINVSSGSNVESFHDMPVRPAKKDGKAGTSEERNRQSHVFFSYEPRDPSDTRAARNLSLPLLPLPRRKTRQELQTEKAAATTIQSAWRGCQVRREIKKMTEAATKIQATFRGHKIRKELPLSLCNHSKSKSKKKIHARKDSESVPEFLHCFQQLGLIGTHTKSQSILPYNDKTRNYLTVIGDYALLSPEVTFLETEMGHRPSKEMFTFSSLNVLAEIEWQRYHNAAIIIQAAWRGFKVRKMIRIIKQTEKSQGTSFRFKYTCEEIIRKDTTSGHRSQLQERRHDNVLLGFVPRIRNINIYTVVKGLPASQRPNISVRVLSPNAVIQGFQREMRVGAQGLYSVKSPGALRPTQVFVHVDIRKELKVLSSLKTEKNQKTGTTKKSKRAAVK